MNSFFNYQPGSPEYSKLFSEAYEEYKNSESHAVQNERLRPEGQDIFEWLLEDKELIEETDRELKAAGFEW